jgi:hypothetical protein
VIAIVVSVVLTVVSIGILVIRLAPRPQRVSSRRRLREAERTTYRAEDRIDQVVSRAVDEMLHLARFGRTESTDTPDHHRFEP